MPAMLNSPEPVRKRAALMLIIFALGAALLLASVERFTRQRIVDNEIAERLKALQALLPLDGYDNQPHLDVARFQAPELLGNVNPSPVYRVRLNGAPVAAIISTIAANGFSGEIRLLVSIGHDGVVTGVRVAEHHETPGLGDAIEEQKSDWIQNFTRLSTASLLTNPLASEWTLDRDGGSFDNITGATVTGRAVINAVRNAALFFHSRRQEIFLPLTAGQPVDQHRVPDDE